MPKTDPHTTKHFLGNTKCECDICLPEYAGIGRQETTMQPIFDDREARAIKHFIQMVEHRAEQKMIITNKLEGSHYAAMKELQKEIGAL